jgi:hypothetical protein
MHGHITGRNVPKDMPGHIGQHRFDGIAALVADAGKASPTAAESYVW